MSTRDNVSVFNQRTTEQEVTQIVDAATVALKDLFNSQDADKGTMQDQIFEGLFRHFKPYNDARQRAEGLGDSQTFAAFDPIYGQKSSQRFKKTDSEEATALNSNAQSASENALSLMPVEEREKIINIIVEQTLPKYLPAVKLAITTTGKPVFQSEGELGKGTAWGKSITGNMKDAFAPEEIIRKDDGTVITNTATRKPLGSMYVSGAANYPFALAIDGILGGFAAGNGVIIAATSKSPYWAFPIQQALQEAVDIYAAGLNTDDPNLSDKDKQWMQGFKAEKDHMFQIATGSNSLLTEIVDGVHFVGSSSVGGNIIKSRTFTLEGTEGYTHTFQKPTIAEMGGNNVVVVMDSGLDVNKDGKPSESREVRATAIANDIINGMAPVGARCTAPRLLCVQKDEETGKDAGLVADELIAMANNDALFAEGGKYMVGNPFDDRTRHGPMLDVEAYKEIKDVIAFANRIGHPDIVSGGPIEGQSGLPVDGHWTRPVVVDLRSLDIAALSEKDQADLEGFLKKEIFGPIIFVTKTVKDIDAAVALTNEHDDPTKYTGKDESGSWRHTSVEGSGEVLSSLSAGIFTGKQEDVDTFSKGTNITAITVNFSPADQSPAGNHGNNVGVVGGPHYLEQHTGRLTDAHTVNNPSAAMMR